MEEKINYNEYMDVANFNFETGGRHKCYLANS